MRKSGADSVAFRSPSSVSDPSRRRVSSSDSRSTCHLFGCDGPTLEAVRDPRVQPEVRTIRENGRSAANARLTAAGKTRSPSLPRTKTSSEGLGPLTPPNPDCTARAETHHKRLRTKSMQKSPQLPLTVPE